MLHQNMMYHHDAQVPNMATPSHLVLPQSPTRPTGTMYQPPQPHGQHPGWAGQQYSQGWMPQPDAFNVPMAAPQYIRPPQYAAPQYAPPPHWGHHPQQQAPPGNGWNQHPAHAEHGHSMFGQPSPYPDISMHAGPLVGKPLHCITFGSFMNYVSM